MITVTKVQEWTPVSPAGGNLASRAIYQLATDAPYSPDVADDLVRRVTEMTDADTDDTDEAEPASPDRAAGVMTEAPPVVGVSAEDIEEAADHFMAAMRQLAEWGRDDDDEGETK